MKPIILCCVVLVISVYFAQLLFSRMKGGESDFWDEGIFYLSMGIGIPFGILIGSAPESSFLGATIWRQIMASLLPLASFGVYFCWLFSVACREKDLSSTVGAIEWHYHIVGMFPLEAQIVGFKRVAPGSEIVIPYEFVDRKVTTIGDNAFMGHEELEKVSFEDYSRVRKIGDKAFYGCSNLQAMKMPSSVSIVGDNAFAYCTRLKEVTWNVSDHVNCRIGRQAFAGCANLEAFTVPAGEVGKDAFTGCNSLKNMSIPHSLEGETKEWDVPTDCKVTIRPCEHHGEGGDISEDSECASENLNSGPKTSEAYRLLGVSESDSDDIIRNAYLAKLRKISDILPHNQALAERMMAEINTAWKTIEEVRS